MSRAERSGEMEVRRCALVFIHAGWCARVGIDSLAIPPAGRGSVDLGGGGSTAAGRQAGSVQWGQIYPGPRNKQGPDMVSGARGTRPRARCPPAAHPRRRAPPTRSLPCRTPARAGTGGQAVGRFRGGWGGFGVARHGMGAWLVPSAMRAGAWGCAVPCRGEWAPHQPLFVAERERGQW
jgi:hypothetical protein